ncbi:MAG TPA: ABC transporter ATP-binding protein [Candidatus Brocadiia bacterium]|nr:ABC transporter ATP-binding protein [Candidatus Brocadiia bacterium]
MISLENVSKSYGNRQTEVMALKSVTLDLPAGEMILLTGPSGSGKTTLLNLIGGLESPASGHIRVCGIDIDKVGEKQLSRFRRRNVGFVFQSYNLLNDLTARDNIRLPLVLNGASEAECGNRSEELLERLGMTRRADAYPVELSGGEQQRVAIARSVAHRPQLLLADEPTANLDSANAASVLELLREIYRAENVTVLLATHDPLLVESAKRKVFLKDGSVMKTEGLV